MTSSIPFLDVPATYGELQQELDEAAQRVMASGQYILGPDVAAFEDEFAEYCGTRHAIGVGSGLDALRLILLGYGIGAGDEVIVPSNTFVATWLAVSQTGATPVPVEPDPATHNITAAAIESAITPATRAIMPVHLYGQTAEMDEITAVGRERGIPIIEDAAQAQGARHRGRRAGGLADAAGFSFYPGKNLGALGDAGAITTDDDELADRVRMLGNYGSKVKYHHDLPGLNSRLDTLQAALLRVKLRRLDEWNDRRRARGSSLPRAAGRRAGRDAACRGGGRRTRLASVCRAPPPPRRAAGPPGRRRSGHDHPLPIPPHLSGAYAQASRTSRCPSPSGSRTRYCRCRSARTCRSRTPTASASRSARRSKT